jgi:hypothetical protein
VNEKAPHCGAFCYRPVVEPGPVGEMVEPLGEGLMWVFPDGFTALLRPAAALPAPLLMPVVALLSAPLPAVVPLVEDPVAPPVPELPPDAPLPDCASATLLATASTAANPNVASFMIAPFPGCITAQHAARACVPGCSITDPCCSLEIPRETWLGNAVEKAEAGHRRPIRFASIDN